MLVITVVPMYQSIPIDDSWPKGSGSVVWGGREEEEEEEEGSVEGVGFSSRPDGVIAQASADTPVVVTLEAGVNGLVRYAHSNGLLEKETNVSP